MIECTSKNGVKVYVTRTYDVEPNIGGFYCQVYLDDDCNYEVDNFTISKEVVDLDLDELFIVKHMRDTVLEVDIPHDIKVRNRGLDNYALLATLRDLIEENPDLRFGQILLNWKFVNWNSCGAGITIHDPFHEEPSDTLKRVKEVIAEMYNN